MEIDQFINLEIISADLLHVKSVEGGFEPSPRQAEGNLHRKDKKSIFSSLANPTASGGESARYRGSNIDPAVNSG
jgi:hypothetical protein